MAEASLEGSRAEVEGLREQLEKAMRMVEALSSDMRSSKEKAEQLEKEVGGAEHAHFWRGGEGGGWRDVFRFD